MHRDPTHRARRSSSTRASSEGEPSRPSSKPPTAAAKPAVDDVLAQLDRGRPFHLATRLKPKRIAVAPAELLQAHLALPIEDQQRLLAEALTEGGLPPEIARAVTIVPRHQLTPEPLRERAYLDEFLRVGDGSGLSPPSLVGLMLELLQLEPGQNVLELGAGSGYHALAVLALEPDSSVVGIEVERRLVDATRAHIERLEIQDRFTVLHGDSAEVARAHAPFDRVYATYAVRHPATAVLPALREGGLALIPRAVNPFELERDPALASLRDEHPDYASLVEVWQRNLCLTTYQRRGDSLYVADKHHGVSFVSEREGDH